MTHLPPFPVWEPPSVAAGRRTTSKTSSTRTASSSWARNMAEAHPVGFQWVMEAKARGAKVIHIDPRFTRTSARRRPVRPAPRGQRHRVPRRGDQLHPGATSWTSASTSRPTRTRRSSSTRSSGTPRTSTGCSAATTRRPRPTTRRPGSTSRRVPAAAERAQRSTPAPDQHRLGWRAARGRQRVTSRRTRRCSTRVASTRSSSGTSPATRRRWSSGSAACLPRQFLDDREGVGGELGPRAHRGAGLQRGLDAAHRRRAVHPRRARSSSCCWATSAGPAAAILALRGHASIQGSTDIPTLFNLLPGYLPMPRAGDARCRTTSTASRPTSRRASGATPTRTWCRCSRSTGASAATAENDFCFDYLPRINGDHGTYRTVMDMVDGKVSGYFLLGQNPAVGLGARPAAAAGHGQPRLAGRARPRRDRERDVLEGRAGDRDRRDRAGDLPHRGVLLPRRVTRGEGGHVHPDRADAAVAREGRRTARATQRSELWFFYHLGRILREKLAGSTDERDRPLLDLSWDYAIGGRRAVAPRTCCGASTAYDLDDEPGRRQLHGAARRTAAPPCGCWIYSGVYARRGQPGGAAQAARPSRNVHVRVGLVVADEPAGALQPGVGRSRRAGHGASARSWSGGTRTGATASGRATTSPTSRRPSRRTTVRPRARSASRRLRGDDPFIMQADGKAWLFAPNGVLDGPMPTHYEPHESPVRNAALRAAGQPGAQGVRAGGQPGEPVAAGAARRGVPVRVHHVAADRAPHGGRDEPAAAVPVRTAAGAVRRGVAASWRRSAGWSTWEWCHVVTSRTAVRPGCT